jgi:hypothetical protein
MKALIIVSFIAAVGLLAAVSGIPRSHLSSSVGQTTSMSTMPDRRNARGADKLPEENFDDRSFVFPRETKR